MPTKIKIKTYRARDAENSRQRSKKNYARHKKAGTLRKRDPFTAEQRNKYAENRRAKSERERCHVRDTRNAYAENYQRAGISIVGRKVASFDLTRWRGPGWNRNERLEKQADEILRRNGL